MTLGELIKSYRKEHHLSQQAFADATKLSKAYISILERNINPVNGKQPVPSVETIKAVANTLGRDFNEIIAVLDPDTQISISSDSERPTIPYNAIPYSPTGLCPILGRIPAGPPTIADECIEGYEPIDRPRSEEYYWLRIQGDSMVNARIFSGDLVLIHMQDFAENGQIVACRINGDEATLKRYREQGDSVILIPENPDYEPQIIDKKEFEIGYASIMGVVVESKRKF